MFQEGQILGDFEILSRLGQGGMGAVYKAQQISLERLVALKTLQGALASDPEYIARFRREAKAAASLNHPNLVQVYAAGETDGLHWFAMEFVEGESAQARMKRKERLDAAEAIAIGIHVATALDYAWRKAQLIHRDIKPDNIFLSSDGEVKLGDLGLAKSAGSENQSLTMTGASMGTPHYVSPEQGQGKKDVDLRADIYSLGCTVFHLVTGQPPYSGDTAMAVMLKHVTEPVPVAQQVWAGCPAELSRVVMKMMLKQPASRQQTYAEVIADLRGAYDALTGAAVPQAVAVTRQPPKPAARAPVPKAAPADIHSTPTILTSQAAAAANGAPRPKSKAPVWIGLAALVVVLGIVLAVTSGKKEPQLTEAERAEKARATGSAASVPKSPVPAVAWQKMDLGAQKNVKLENGRHTVTGTGMLISSGWTENVRDMAVRVRAVQAPDARGFEIWLRASPGQDRYQGMLPDQNGAAGGIHFYTRDRAAENRAIRESAVPPVKWDGRTEHELEFRAVGESLTLLLDGAVIATATDTRLREGKFSVNLRAGVVLSSVEHAILDTPGKITPAPAPQVPAPSVPPAATPKQTIDLLTLTDPAKDRLTLPTLMGRNEWVNEGGALVYKPDGKAGKVIPPVRIAAPRCEIEISYRRTSGKGRLHVDIPLDGGRILPIYLDAPGMKIINNKIGPAWPASTPADGRITIRFQRGTGGATDRVEVQPEGAVPMVWTGDDVSKYKAIVPVEAHPAFPGEPVTSLFAFADGYEIRAWTLRVFEGEAKVLRGAVSPAGSINTPAAATKDAPFVNTLGMKFVPVPIGGGPTKGERVLFGVWHTRVQDYAAYAAAQESAGKKVVGFWKTQEKDGVPAGHEPDHPVVGVSWEDAQAFCQWLTAKETAEGKLPQGMKYRLPSDEEWSWAAGLPPELGATPEEKSGKNSVDFPWGKDFPPTKKVGNYADETFHGKFPPKKDGKMENDQWMKDYTDGFATTSPVGSFPANAYGLHDMGGNVWQWCEDWLNAEHKDRVLRGASWDRHDRNNLRSSYRYRSPATIRYHSLGFRCVVSAGSAPAAASISPSPSSASSEVWQDALAEWWAKPGNAQQGLLIKESGGSRTTSKPGVIQCGEHQDVALRATVRAVTGGSWNLWLRHTLDKGKGTSYCASLGATWFALKAQAQGQDTVLKSISLPAGFSITDPHTVEFRAQGDELTLFLDGRQVAQVRDARHKTGTAHLTATPGMLIEKLEFRDLGGGAPTPAAKPASGEVWVDVLQEYFARPADQRRPVFIEPSPEGWKVTKAWVAFNIPPIAKPNVALRATVRGMQALILVLRTSGGDTTKNLRNYQATLKSDGSVVILRRDLTQPSPIVELSHSAPVPGFSPDARHTFEFRAVDDLLTATVDGRVIESVRDASLTEGGLSFSGNAGMIVEKLEMANLTGVKAAAAAPVGSTATATKDAPFENTLGMKFVPVPITGGPTGGQRVLFSVWETRVQDYEAFIKEAKRNWPKVTEVEQGPTHPAAGVNWDGAVAFCAWLTQREQAAGRIAPGDRYRLPSDHEWSCAVGIGDREDATKLPADKHGGLAGVYPWGNTWPPPANSGNFSSEELRTLIASRKHASVQGELKDYRDGFATLAPVGSFAANALGLHDLGGNAWEWCEDWFDSAKRVMRGGSYSWGRSSNPEDLLSSHRRATAPADPLRYGFRCVLAPAAQQASGAPATAKDAPFVNSLGMKFVPVPGTKAVFSIWHTRVQDYAEFAKAQEAAGKTVDGSWKTQEKEGVPVGRELDHPVVAVSWEDAQAFCAWLTAKEQAEGKLASGMKYRLPGDEEWSWAAGLPAEAGATPEVKHGKNSVDFPWGRDWPPPMKAGNYADETYHAKFPKPDPQFPRTTNKWIAGYTDGYATTSTAGSFPANAHGLHDMGGNVWQWCDDWWNAQQKDRVLRGNSFPESNRDRMFSSVRHHTPPGVRYNNHGFRCVLAPVPVPGGNVPR